MIAAMCSRCGRLHDGDGDWNVAITDGEITGSLCPACQTPEEHIAATINEATLDYATDANGRVVTAPKGTTSSLRVHAIPQHVHLAVDGQTLEMTPAQARALCRELARAAQVADRLRGVHGHG